MNVKAQADVRPIGHAKPLGIAGKQTHPGGSIAPYVIALSQADVVEQARWIAALDRRTKHTVRTVRVENLNQLLADTMTLRDLCKKSPNGATARRRSSNRYTGRRIGAGRPR